MAETASAHDGVPEALRSHLVKPEEMEWRTTVFEGVEMKPLYVDRETGLLTVLMRMAPGSVLPDHEHVQVERPTFFREPWSTRRAPRRDSASGPASTFSAAIVAADNSSMVLRRAPGIMSASPKPRASMQVPQSSTPSFPSGGSWSPT